MAFLGGRPARGLPILPRAGPVALLPVLACLLLGCSGCAGAPRLPFERVATPAQRLALAAREDRPAEVRRLLAAGVSDDGLQPALGAAAAVGSVRVLELLLEAGADPRLPVDRMRYTALHRAVRHPAAMERLLAAGSELEARNAHGLTPLLEAARMGSAQGLRILIRHGADSRATTNRGAGALHLAAGWGHREVIALLLDGGALRLDVAAPVQDQILFRRAGGTPLMLAAAGGYAPAVDLLLEAGADPDARNAKGQTALMLAASYGHDRAVDRLLAAGADPDAADQEGATALLAAARKLRRSTVERLLRAGARPVAESPPGSGPQAVLPESAWDVELLRLLLDAAETAGADLGAEAADLLYQAAGYNPKAVRILLSAGVSPDAPSWTRHASTGTPGRRALTSAVHAGNEETAALLIQAGAEVSYEIVGSHHTPLSLAIALNRTGVAQLLRDAGAVEPVLVTPTPLAQLERALGDGDDAAALDLVASGAHLTDPARALEEAVRRGRATVVETLLGDLDRRSAAAEPPGGLPDRLVHLAVSGGPPFCTAGHARTLDLLAARGLAIDPPGPRGRTPLMEAADRGCPSLLLGLLRAGGRPNLTDQEGWTPLMLAVNPFSEHEPGVVRRMVGALLEHGAEVGLRNEDGATALAMAAVVGPQDLVRRLLSSVDRDRSDVVRDARAVATESGNAAAVGLFDRWLGR